MTTDKYVALPKDISSSSFSAAIKKFRAAIGDEYVAISADRIAPYSKIMIPSDDETHMPSGALIPKDVEQVQKIVHICNEFKIPISYAGTGRFNSSNTEI